MAALLRMVFLLMVLSGVAGERPARAAMAANGPLARPSAVPAALVADAPGYMRLALAGEGPVRNPRRRTGGGDAQVTAGDRAPAPSAIRRAAVVRKPALTDSSADPETATAALPTPAPATATATATATEPESAAETAPLPSPSNDAAVPPSGAAEGGEGSEGEASHHSPPQTRGVALATGADTPAPGMARIEFAASAADLNRDASARLDRIAREIGANENLRLQLRAYAEAGGGSNSKARRLSLARALAVRTHLIENGIAAKRIDVRALGDAADGPPRDRVDVQVVDR